MAGLFRRGANRVEKWRIRDGSRRSVQMHGFSRNWIKAYRSTALKEFYKKSWEGVEARIHEVHKIFPMGQGDNALELMVDGTSHYTFKDGTKGGGKWAARQKYIREGSALKVQEYAVHFVSVPRVTCLSRADR